MLSIIIIACGRLNYKIQKSPVLLFFVEFKPLGDRNAERSKQIETARGSATNRIGGGGAMAPQLLEKINEFLKFTIHF